MKSLKQNFYSRNGAIISAFLVIELLISAPAFAHHPLDGRLPANLFEGLMSGLGHAVIGFDHLAFVIASGLIALGIVGGIIIPLAFVIATTIGAGIHLASIDLPFPEIFIAASVVMFGVLLILRGKKRQNSDYTWKVSY